MWRELRILYRERRDIFRSSAIRRLLFLILMYLVRVTASVYGIWLTWYMLAFMPWVDHKTGMVVSAYDALTVFFCYLLWRYTSYMDKLEEMEDMQRYHLQVLNSKRS